MVERYSVAKAAREVLDHGDQVALAARIAHRHPEVRAAERSRYKVVLLDEYQDTSHAQLMLLRALFGGGHPVTAVGDPCQSIYGWRGASAGNLRRFVTDFPARKSGEGGPPGPAAVHQLPQLGEGPRCRLGPAGGTARGGAGCSLAGPGTGPCGSRRPSPARCCDRQRRGGLGGGQAPAAAGLAGWSAPDGRAMARRPGGRRPPSDIAVLCRKRSQFGLVRQELAARGIPCEVVGLGGLLGVPEVQDVVATLRVIHDASASDALARHPDRAALADRPP